MSVCGSRLGRRIEELEGILERLDDEHKQEFTELTARLQDKTTEAATLRLDVERLRVSDHYVNSTSQTYTPIILR